MTGRKRRRPRNTPPEIELEVQRLADLGYTAPEIWNSLPKSERPTVRTIYRILGDKFPLDPSGAWRPLHSPAAASLVLPVLACVVEVTRGRRVSLTNAEAQRVEALRESVPDLPLWETYLLAQAYVAAEYHKADTEPLDMVLSFAPWRSVEHVERYYAAVKAGRIPPPAIGLLQITLLAMRTLKGKVPMRVIDKNKAPETAAYYKRLALSQLLGGTHDQER